MKTVTVGIGNSDDKLSQLEWVSYAYTIYKTIELFAEEIHFYGYSLPNVSWQNACWVFNVKESNIETLKENISNIRITYRQNSVAWTEGDTEKI